MSEITPYELLIGTSSSRILLTKKANNSLQYGWEMRGYPLIRLDQPIPWRLEDHSQRSWNFHIHCWDMLEPLLAIFSQDGDEKYLTPCIRIACEWAHENLSESDDSGLSFAWYDMAVGLRAYRLAYIIDAGRHADLLSDENEALLWEALLVHQSYLENDSNIIFHNNHGYYQVAGQLAMGRRFRHSSSLMEESYLQGEKRLQRMLKQQFAIDGVHREHSPDYHRMVYDTLCGLIASELVTDPTILALVEHIEGALAWFIMPNQRLVNFGDSDYRDMSRKPEEAERKWKTPAMRWLVSGGLVGENTAEGLRRFDDGGYLVYRQPQPEFSSQGSYLAQIAAFHSRTHKHADDLSFIWYDRGSEILIDAGRYGYLGKTQKNSKLWLEGHWYSDPKRIYCESTRAHNCLEFDGQNYPRKHVKPYGTALGRSLEDDSGLVVMETECRHFKGNRHARILILNPGQWLIVFDWHHDNLKAKHTIKQWFHLAPEWKLCPNSSGFHAFSSLTGKRLCIETFGKDASPSRPYLGELEPLTQGWWSPAERQFIPSYAFCFSAQKAVTGSIATIFSFSELKAGHSEVKVNKVGRQIRLAWFSEQSSHILNINRPEVGEIKLEYEAISCSMEADL